MTSQSHTSSLGSSLHAVLVHCMHGFVGTTAMDNALNEMRDEAFRKGLEAGETKWHRISETTPENKMLLLTNDNWPVSQLRGENPPVKVGYYFTEERRWVILGATWFPTRWAEIPYPRPVNAK